jgi:hypothetical protein
LFSWKVNFLHRTVRDFLLLDDTTKILERWYSPAFGPHETICKALFAQIKYAPEERGYWDMDGPIAHLYSLFNQYSHLQSFRNVMELRRDVEAVLDLRGAKFAREGELLNDEERSPVSRRSPSIPRVQEAGVREEPQGMFRKYLGKLHEKWLNKKGGGLHTRDYG